LFGLLTWQQAPVLHRDDVSTGGALLLLAAATLIAANLATSRAARDGSDELYSGIVSSAGVRTLGHLLSLLWAVGASLVVGGIMIVYLLIDSPVGVPRIPELLVGPLCVLLLGALGIALARWNPHPAVGPFAVVVVLALEVLLIQPIVRLNGTNGTAARSTWLALWTPLGLTNGVPSELAIRPSWWHALYLCGLGALFGVIALSRHGTRRTQTLALVGASAAILLGGVAQLQAPSAEARRALGHLLTDPQDHQVCEERVGVTYCAYPAYVPWVERWATPIENLFDDVPLSSRPQNLVVRQSFGSYFEGPTDVPHVTLRRIERQATPRGAAYGSPTLLPVGAEWGRGKMEGDYEMRSALFVAMQAVGIPQEWSDFVLTADDVAYLKRTLLPSMPKARRETFASRRLRVGAHWDSCHTSGQARSVVALWLAGQATAATESMMERVAAESPYGLLIDERAGTVAYNGPLSPLYPLNATPIFERVNLGSAEFHYAVRLLERPNDEVKTTLLAHWGELTDPDTDTSTLLTMFGLEPFPTIEAQLAALPSNITPLYGDRISTPDQYFAGVVPCH
jgi:predicted phage tail protein